MDRQTLLILPALRRYRLLAAHEIDDALRLKLAKFLLRVDATGTHATVRDRLLRVESLPTAARTDKLIRTTPSHILRLMCTETDTDPCGYDSLLVIG
jgi:hypothetical protein